MRVIEIVIDGSADLPPSLQNQSHLFVVPQIVVVDDERLQVGVDISLDEVYRLMAAGRSVRAGHPSPDDFRLIFKKMASQVEGIVVVAPSTAFNPTLVSAAVAAVTYKKLPVEVVNTRLVSSGVGLVAVAAAQAAAQGLPLEDVARHTREAVDRVRVAFLAGDLTSLRQHLHISPLAQRVHSALKHTALLTLSERGLLDVIAYVPRDEGQNRLVEWLASSLPAAATRAIVMHAAVPHEAEQLREAVVRRLGIEQVDVVDLTPMVSVRTGVGTLGVAVSTF